MSHSIQESWDYFMNLKKIMGFGSKNVFNN